MKKEERKIDRTIKRGLVVALVLSGSFILGVPMIIFGAVKGMWGVLAIGIVCCVMGFYGAPIAWTSFGEKKRVERVVDCVTKENILSVKEIAGQLQWKEGDVRGILQRAIVGGHIEGYIFDGEKLVVNEKRTTKKQKVQNKCSACGATLIRSSEGFVCPYCGATFEEK